MAPLAHTKEASSRRTSKGRRTAHLYADWRFRLLVFHLHHLLQQAIPLLKALILSLQLAQPLAQTVHLLFVCLHLSLQRRQTSMSVGLAKLRWLNRLRLSAYTLPLPVAFLGKLVPPICRSCKLGSLLPCSQEGFSSEASRSSTKSIWPVSQRIQWLPCLAAQLKQ